MDITYPTDETVGIVHNEATNPVDTTDGNVAMNNFLNTNAHFNNEMGQQFDDQNYHHEQNNGVTGDPNSENVNKNYVSCAPAPMVEIKLFCGRVPKTMNEDDIKNVFEEFGTVKEVVIIRDKESNLHKSSAFVRMASIAHADAAILALNGQRTLDPAMGTLQVKYAHNETSKLNLADTTATEPGVHQAKVFVGSLPKSVNEDMIRELFAPYGRVDEVFVMTDKATGVGKGCSFVKFAFKEQALYAMKSLDGKRTLEGCSRPIEVRFAETKTKPQPQYNQFPPPHITHPTHPYNNMMSNNMPIMPPTTPLPPPNTPRSSGPWKEYISPEGRPYYHNEQTQVVQWDRPNDFDQIMNNQNMQSSGAFGPKGANIFIFYIPNEWTHNDLINAFGPFGNIISARIATDRHTGRNKGYAFVSYDNAQSASNAVHHMNGFFALSKRLKVSIKKGEEPFGDHMMNSMSPGHSGGSSSGNEPMRNNFYSIGGQPSHYPSYRMS